MPDSKPSKYIKWVEFADNFCAFGLAFLKHWLWWAGFTLGSLTVALAERWVAVIPSWASGLIALLGVVVASFLAFCDQRRIASDLRRELESLKKADPAANALTQSILSKAESVKIDGESRGYSRDKSNGEILCPTCQSNEKYAIVKWVAWRKRYECNVCGKLFKK